MALHRVAVVQAASVLFDQEKTVQKVQDLVADAARQGAKLVVFPEAFISGYPRGMDFGATVGNRTPEGRENFLRYWNSAVEVPGAITERLSAVSQDNGIHLVIGVIERDAGTLYCDVLFFSPDGSFLGKHRKLMPTASERLIWGFGDGSTMPVYETALGRIGAVICWENYMPMLRTYMYSQGVQIYCAPTADHRDVWGASMRHIAREGGCFVLSCNQFTRRADYPEDYDADLGDDPETVISRGGSCIVDPFGEWLAGPNYDGECILTADIDLDQIVRAKFDFDVAGHYSRPDVFRLSVNTARMPGVVSTDLDTANGASATDSKKHGR